MEPEKTAKEVAKMDKCCVCGAGLTGSARVAIRTCPSCGADLAICEHEHRARTVEPEFMSAEPPAAHGDRAPGAVEGDVGVNVRREHPRGPGLSETEPGRPGPV